MSGVENDELRDRRASRVEERATSSTTNVSDQQDALRRHTRRRHHIPVNDENSIWMTYLSSMSNEPPRSISMGGKDWNFLSPATHGRIIFLGGVSVHHVI